MSGYDTTLLASAPEATRAQLQEGYNPNLLETGKKRDAEVESPNGKEGNPPNTNSTQRRAVPWFRTTQGIIIIVVAAIVIIAVIIGGAVGGTRHKTSHVLTGTNITSIANTTSTSNSTTSTESQNVEGATATDTPSSTTSPAPAQSVQSDPQPKPKPPRRRREKRSTRGD